MRIDGAGAGPQWPERTRAAGKPETTGAPDPGTTGKPDGVGKPDSTPPTSPPAHGVSRLLEAGHFAGKTNESMLAKRFGVIVPEPAAETPAADPAVTDPPTDTTPPLDDPPVTPPTDETPPADDPVVPPAGDPVVPPADDPVVPPAGDPVVPPAGDPVVPPADDPVVPPADDPAAPTGDAVDPTISTDLTGQLIDALTDQEPAAA